MGGNILSVLAGSEACDFLKGIFNGLGNGFLEDESSLF